ncbi:MAG: putative fatty-acid--CoA ligase [Acidimicrobiales bacterium]|nr:putative fatty-acid--CoA ligase [Acidimicrobiales bacterium]
MPNELTPTYHAVHRPDTVALVMAGTGEEVTYAELEDRSNRFAHLLRSRGIAQGEHVAILMENNRAYLEVVWAAQRSGLYYTAINRHLRPGEVQYVLEDCGAVALVASESMADVVADLDVSGLRLLVSGAGDLPGFERYDDVIAGQPGTPHPDECEGREMLYSSGTTGRPKGVCKTLAATSLGDPSAPTVQIAQNLVAQGAGPGTVYLSPAPLYHSAPLVYSTSLLRLGATVVVMEHFDPAACLELIERYRVTHAQFVPTMFVRLLRLPPEERAQWDTSSLQVVLHAAAPCPIPVKRQMLDWWGPIIHEYYAGTEDIGSTFITAEEWLAHPGSVGRPLSEVHIVGEDGEELPVGEAGVVYFGGGRPFEYHNDPEKTASVTDPRGWRTLGDIGRLDDEGYLYLTDRQAHMIISGGVNIYPQEAENVLASHPAVTDVAVIGVPDEEMGEAVKAVVQATDPTAAGPELAEALLAHCRAELATYKCPRTVDFVDELPRDPSGKLYKRLLRERYWAGHDSLVI